MLEIFKVVLVDDDEDDRLFFQDAIEELKLKTNLILFKNGLELMDYLNGHTFELPHIIFLDLNMPIKNGLQCLKEIRSNDIFKQLSIAIYSTSSTESDILETYIHGANIYFTKPSNFSLLKKAIKKVLSINWQLHTTNLDRENFLLRL